MTVQKVVMMIEVIVEKRGGAENAVVPNDRGKKKE
jgi:hypothetical protein